MRTLRGVVVSNKMKKTVVVLVTQKKHSPKYPTVYERRKRFKAHDEKGECMVGDTVAIEATRPLSREKRWRVVSRLQSAKSESRGRTGEAPSA